VTSELRALRIMVALRIADWWHKWLGNSREKLDRSAANVWSKHFTEEVDCIKLLAYSMLLITVQLS